MKGEEPATEAPVNGLSSEITKRRVLGYFCLISYLASSTERGVRKEVKGFVPSKKNPWRLLARKVHKRVYFIRECLFL